MRFGKKGENDERTPPRPTHLSLVPYIVCGSLRGLNKNPQKIVNLKFQIVHGALCGLYKTIKSRPDSYAFPGVSYARDLQAQGACALRFF